MSAKGLGRPRRGDDPYVTVTFRLPPSLGEQAAACAARLRMTRSEFIRESLVQAIRREALAV